MLLNVHTKHVRDIRNAYFTSYFVNSGNFRNNVYGNISNLNLIALKSFRNKQQITKAPYFFFKFMGKFWRKM
jgi:hypothetical protein